ncbi:oligoendopeptidase F [Spiroplasma tabanidicola]|uniref:Oligopeptidase F n=1 Tax=Spiroplasma tabanidicola TaxID=324079 RepID=A0A6I6CBN9_9MOLU|nr:oligoendopeptidase F [Spiroplasma tabanidicola]QGS52385.1 oligoendopeptidase F [Spiroplasma tabanidicola]
MKRNEAKQNYKWDFSHLYKNGNEFKKDLEVLKQQFDKLESMKGQLNNNNKFLEYLKLDKEIDYLFAKLNQYIHMYDVDQANSELQELQGLFQNTYQECFSKVSFFDPEVISVGKETILGFLKGSEFESETYIFEKLFRKQKHILDDESESLLSKVARSRGAVGELYDTLAYADNIEEKILIDGKEEVVDTTLYRKIMEDSDPTEDQNLRKEVWEKRFINYKSRKYSYAKIYEGILLKDVENYKIRNYESSLEMSLKRDNVPVSVYEKLLETGKKHIQVLKNYYLLIKEKYGFKKFNSTDRELVLTKEFNKTYSVDEGIKIVKDSLKVLGDEYVEFLDKASRPNAIDYYEDKTKRSGAYSSGGYGVEPIILMNWSDKLSSLSTLAHELGHSVHTYLSNKYQPFPLGNYPLILAEVASTFNEHILFDYTYKNLKDDSEKVYLLQQRIFDLCSTFYRQIQFAEFEYQAHKMAEKGEPITADSLMNLFLDIENKYGYDIFDDKDRDAFQWPYIGHFFFSPFYVYKYAVDITASFKLYDDFKKNGPESILNFLKSGGHKDPLDILKDCGVDFNKEETYMPLINEIDHLTKELKKLI